ncbi:hypothetical protein B0T19DRAFT_100008 [Cercophora scortea]|uniref:Uncharacterized protein n=1 Tax=Cercophora scortea TaxID=314031 RepID=A0AAE0IXF4_9PEZI|nr:hypothetical protein B0T19DRAFT_100008 [Cercophora scortea]
MTRSSLSSTPQDRPLSRVSLARSSMTYHSFRDMELDSQQPVAVPGPGSTPPALDSSRMTVSKSQERPVVQEMRRQDSGYESLARPTSVSSRRRTSTASAASSVHKRHTRPSIQRCAKSGPVSHLPRHSISPPRSYQSRPSQPQQPVTYFHFPHFTSSEPALDETEMVDTHGSRDYSSSSSHPPVCETPSHPLPPQTTHYWTSDRTRRLEYAAIDAASRGVRGWIRRHMVPDCIIPKNKRPVVFDDDRGSVVRYRLDLDEGEEEEQEKDMEKGKRQRGWWFNSRHH